MEKAVFETNKVSKIVTLEFCRFIAASLVICAHLVATINSRFAMSGESIFGGWKPGTELPLNVEGFLIYSGEFSVQFFFTLSGFVIAIAHYGDFGKIESVPRFLWRRALRIYPTYWLAIIIAMFSSKIFWTPKYAVQQIFLLPWQTKFVVFSAWSLSCELVFYIMFAICLLPRIGRPFLIFWMLLSLWRWCPEEVLRTLHLSIPILRSILPSDPLNPVARDSEFFSFLSFYFFGGLIAGIIFVRFNRLRSLYPASLIIGVLLIIFVLPPLESYGPYLLPPMRILCLAFSIGCVILGLAGIERQHPFITNIPGKRMGAISYPLYILHVPLIGLVIGWFPVIRYTAPQLYIVFFLLLFFAFIIAYFVAFFFEKPLHLLFRPRTIYEKN